MDQNYQFMDLASPFDLMKEVKILFLVNFMADYNLITN